jgi:hypothetical protein
MWWIGVSMERHDGNLARTAALGVTVFVIGLVTLRRDPVRPDMQALIPGADHPPWPIPACIETATRS